jgi:hypothetical protein
MGVDPATLTAGASLVGAGTGLYGAATANNNAASTQASIANANLQNSENQQQYERALNTIAMQRSTAGTVDGQGGSTVLLRTRGRPHLVRPNALFRMQAMLHR